MMESKIVLASVPMIPSVARSLMRLVPGESSAVLAVSGGSDSLCMMIMAAALRCAGDWTPDLRVCFVDHGLRAGIDEEWRLVADRADSIGIEARRLSIPGEVVEEARGSGSIQEWARTQRYSLLRDFCLETGADRMVTAHTMDDQAETVLLRLLRGAGIDGLGGIPEVRDLQGVSVVRPMLSTRRTRLREILTELGVDWVDDPSNQDDRFSRVRVRQELLPLMESMSPGVGGRLASLATEARGVTEYLGGVVEDERNLIKLRLHGGVRIDAGVFTAIPRVFWGRLIRFALRRVRGDLRGLERAHLEPIELLLQEGTSTDELPVPGDVKVYAHRGSLILFGSKLPARPTGAGQPTAMGAGVWRARFAALGASAEMSAGDSVDVRDLEVRARLQGDRVWGSRRKFKELLSSSGIPRPYRDFVPVLVLDDQVVSCPGLLPSRIEGLEVRWVLDDRAAILDMDFPITSSDQ